MDKGINVLSLFDGMSCGQIALERANIKVNKYYASEIDKFAIKVTQENYPNTIQIGDVKELKEKDLPKMDLLIGGSPCQSFSNAGGGKGFGGKSGLFWEYVRLLNKIKPKYFLLENVVMKKEWENIISDAIGVNPIKINSKLFSAQNRPRLYWTNIDVDNPVDKKIYLKDIIDNKVKEKYYLSEKAISRVNRNKFGGRLDANINTEKSKTLIAGYYKIPSDGTYFNDGYGIRRYTPDECERLQTVPLGYTKTASDTQRYKMLGNGWTVDVIAHIFKNIK